MAERTGNRNRETPTEDRRDETDRGYDETVHRGPPLDTSVARGDYRPGGDTLAGAGVRGFGERDYSERWGHGELDTERAPETFQGNSGDYAPASGFPAGFGSADGGY